jgi:hypothetical protein
METDQTIIKLLNSIKRHKEITHNIVYGFECMGGQESCIINTDENGKYLQENAKDRLEFYQRAINKVLNRKKGTLPLEWSEILPEDLVDELNKNPLASEWLYHYFYNNLGGINWKYWSINEEKRTEKCIKVAKKCLKFISLLN